MDGSGIGELVREYLAQVDKVPVEARRDYLLRGAQSIGGNYPEVNYQYLYGIAPNIQAAFEVLNNAIEARKDIKDLIARAKDGG